MAQAGSTSNHINLLVELLGNYEYTGEAAPRVHTVIASGFWLLVISASWIFSGSRH